MDGNPNLCVMAPCKKEKKNFVVPLIAATVSALVVLTMLVVCWRCKRKQGIRGTKFLYCDLNHLIINTINTEIILLLFLRCYHIKKNKNEIFFKIP